MIVTDPHRSRCACICAVCKQSTSVCSAPCPGHYYRTGVPAMRMACGAQVFAAVGGKSPIVVISVGKQTKVDRVGVRSLIKPACDLLRHLISHYDSNSGECEGCRRGCIRLRRGLRGADVYVPVHSLRRGACDAVIFRRGGDIMAGLVLAGTPVRDQLQASVQHLLAIRDAIVDCQIMLAAQTHTLRRRYTRLRTIRAIQRGLFLGQAVRLLREHRCCEAPLALPRPDVLLPRSFLQRSSADALSAARHNLAAAELTSAQIRGFIVGVLGDLQRREDPRLRIRSLIAPMQL